jgi:hypothetical protein
MTHQDQATSRLRAAVVGGGIDCGDGALNSRVGDCPKNASLAAKVM